MENVPQINIPQMCNTHQVLLTRQLGLKPVDPWRAFIIASQITLFQAATSDPKTHKKIGGDITKITKLGCLACYKPDAFGQIIVSGMKGGISEIKSLGEKWAEEPKI